MDVGVSQLFLREQDDLRYSENIGGLSRRSVLGCIDRRLQVAASTYLRRSSVGLLEDFDFRPSSYGVHIPTKSRCHKVSSALQPFAISGRLPSIAVRVRRKSTGKARARVIVFSLFLSTFSRAMMCSRGSSF